MSWWTKAQTWLLTAGAALLLLAAAWFKGRQGGKEAARQEAQEDALEQATETNIEIKEVQSEVRSLPAGGASARLKRDWVRKSK